MKKRTEFYEQYRKEIQSDGNNRTPERIAAIASISDRPPREDAPELKLNPVNR